MRLLDLFKRKKKIKKEPNIDIKKTVKSELSIANNFFVVHSDIKDLVWIKNGPKKNYIPASPKNQKFELDSFIITFSIMNEEEPSLIDLNKTVNKPSKEIDRPPYYPTYETLTPEQRYQYWAFLANPYNNSVDTGYLFIFYYGLERHLLEGKIEKAIEIIVRLRDVHSNKSFQYYSGNAITLSCIKNKRPDLMQRFLDSLDKEHEYHFSDSLLLLALYSFNKPLTAKDIIRLSKSFGYTKTNYVKGYPELFERVLSDRIQSNYGQKDIMLADLITDLSQVKSSRLQLFANMSLMNKEVAFPDILLDTKFTGVINTLLNDTHEQLKSDLAEMRKNNIAPQKKNNSKPKKVIKFDQMEERRLLKELGKNKEDPVNKHFTYIQLQDFYYKYRNLDPKYLNECIAYCFKDIESLKELHESYVNQRIKDEMSLIDYRSKLESDNNIDKIVKEKFQGRIPAFNRLAIIYEKKKDYEKAIEVSKQAIAYYQDLNDEVNLDDFVKRIARLEKKVSNV
ncbi:TerB N-terminal domain-containing protein [Oceanobacillus jeddahense]|uniref:TerB N-terminal domain-containing protein n=1 Tax=Oceanobacillus jeddahense TaxID=1462527 RepID=UPI000595A3D9|nr:TerB N-terminal domain-containing protein [Oceanobacillus jeddahense]